MNKKEWNNKLRPYSQANNKKAIIQLINTFLVYLILFTGTIFYQSEYGFGLFTIPLTLISGLFMVRTFILFHDCTHLSFVTSKKANQRLGFLLGVFAFSDYKAWQSDHNIHHGSVGNLDRRGVGDVWTLTIDEYQGKSRFIKAIYRLFRHPLFLFTVAPFFLFFVLHRLPKKDVAKAVNRSVWLTNLAIVVVGVSFSLVFGWSAYVIIQLLTLFFASSIGVWLFYVQHQFEEVYWEEGVAWNSVDAALMGSTFYKLPVVLEWMSGYIGYHHIHHLNSRIPNYYLKACSKDVTELTNAKTVTFFESLHLAFLQIYDENTKRLISFRQYHLMQRQHIY